jgi:hypothetical protein
MAVTSTPVFPQTIKNSFAKIVTADASTFKTLYTGGANGSRIDLLLVTSTDTTARDVQLVIQASGVDYILGTISIPINSGNTNAITHLSVFQNSIFPGLNVDAIGNRVLYLESGIILKAKTLTTVTAAKEVNFIVQGADF